MNVVDGQPENIMPVLMLSSGEAIKTLEQLVRDFSK